MFNAVDIIVVGRFSGSQALAAVGSTTALINVFINLFMGISLGANVLAARYYAAGRDREMSETVHTSIMLALISGVVMAFVGVFFAKGALELMDTPADVIDQSALYMRIYFMGMPFFMLYNYGAAILRAVGDTKRPLYFLIVSGVINAGLNMFLVIVFSLGVAGVAIPSLISRAVAGFILYRLLKNPSNEVHLLKESFHIDWPVIHKIFYIGIPSGIENGIFQLGRVIVVSIIAGFGTVQIAANGVANSLDSMGCIVGQAMNLAMITVIGRCVGAGDSGQVRYYTKKLLKITYLCTFMVNSVILLCLSWILKCYGLSPETTQLSYILVMIHNGMAMFLWPASFVLPNMLRACNDVRFTMVLSIFSMFVFRIGFSYIIGVNMGYGAIGVWIAMVLDWIFRVICFVGRYLSGHWLKTAGLQDNR